MTATLTPAKVRRYVNGVRKHPVRWVQHNLGATPWAKQRELLRALAKYKFVTCASANAVGKSFTAACAALVYSESHTPSYVITTSSSWRGVERVLWPEIRRLHRYAPMNLGGKMLNTEWKRGLQWGMFGVSADLPENFAGFRAGDGVFVIVDEASALEPKIFEAIMGLCSHPESRVLLIGNPLRPEGPFYDTFGSPDWKKFHISAFDVPNVTGDEPEIPGLANEEWIAEREREWGKDTPAYLARVKGEFPKSSIDALVPRGWTEAMTARKKPRRVGALRMGVDVARYGMDRTLLVVRDNRSVLSRLAYDKTSITQVIGCTIAYAKKWKVRPDHIFVDDSGVGGGVTDGLVEAGWDVNAFVGAERAEQDELYHNKRAECYWRMRQAMNPETKYSFLVPRRYKELLQELVIPRYHYDSKGRIQVESKENIRKRLSRSPDEADALSMTFGDPGGNFSIGSA